MHNDETDPKASPENAVPEPGQVYQAVAESTAIAIEDAVYALRNVEAIDVAAAGAAIAQVLRPSSGPPPAPKADGGEGGAS